MQPEIREVNMVHIGFVIKRRSGGSNSIKAPVGEIIMREMSYRFLSMTFNNDVMDLDTPPDSKLLIMNKIFFNDIP